MIAGYVRVSTLRQADEGVSIEMQQQMIIHHAKMLELIESENEIHFYIDDGYSGSSLERPKMKELIKAIKRKEVTILMAYDLSRVSRDMFDSNTFLNMAAKYDVVTKFLYDDVNLTTAANRFSTNIKILTNQYEREKIVERTNDSLKSIAESRRYPCGGPMPFGYYRGEDKDIYVDDYNAEIVKKIYDLAARGYELSVIIDYVKTNTKAIKAFPERIMRLIRDTKYKGEYVYKGKLYTDMIPAIVDSETFDEANFNFKKWIAQKDNNYIFSGTVVCSKCNTVMRCSHAVNHQGVRFYYYKCGKCKKQISQLKLEKQFIQLDKSTNSYKVYREKLFSKRRHLKAKIKEVKNNYKFELIGNDEFYRLGVNLESQLNDLNRKIESIGVIKYESWWDLEKKIEYIRTRVICIIYELTKKEIKNIKFVDYSENEEDN